MHRECCVRLYLYTPLDPNHISSTYLISHISLLCSLAKISQYENEGIHEWTNDLFFFFSGSGRHHLLPLLSSLSSLVLYLRRLQHSAFLSLSRQLQSAEAWRLLCHSSLALLILYNRRRECEVSKLSINEYCARITPQCPVPVPPGAPPALTPLEASLSPFERLVLPHLPRVGVQGKRGRVQPLILPPHCEPCLELLLQTRQDVGVDPANPYVFARPYHSPATPLRGTDLLRSLARSSGTRNPRALTQTRVRRQVAILTQLLLLGEGEEPCQSGASAVERLEHFLEREYHVTQDCAGIGQDPGLMGRVGRVVLCGERDGVLFRGMSLNQICLELDGEIIVWRSGTMGFRISSCVKQFPLGGGVCLLSRGTLRRSRFDIFPSNSSITPLLSVMSGNSADSYSEGDSEGEQMKEKPEGPTTAAAPEPAPTLLYIRKGKSNGRVGRPKKLKNSQLPALPTPPVHRRRGSGR